jgi:tRNA dimethylallyltransferase
MMNIPAKSKVIVICGPTGIGKTATAIHLAQRFDGEIISADSMQIFRYMDIGTAKPTPAEQALVKHHMIDIIDPDISFDAAQYEKMGRERTGQIHQLRKSVFVVGGTGLYIKALVSGLFKSQPTDPEIRRRLRTEADTQGLEPLYQRLVQTDPEAAKRIHPNDGYRIVRAMELFESTKKNLTHHHDKHRFSDIPYEVLKIGLRIDRQSLYRRIDHRVLTMADDGFLKEVKMLMDRGYGPNLKPMQAIGYRHMISFIQERLSWDETLEVLQRDTRRYAKRQMTWFRADPEMHWHTPAQLEKIGQRIKTFLKV